MTPSFAFGLILIVMGISFLMGFSFFKAIFSLLIIAFGIKLLLNDEKKIETAPKQTTNENSLNEIAIFSALNKHIKSDNFKNGKAVMVFAGGQIDLRDAKTENKEINLELIVVAGGIRVFIPKNWKVNIKGTAILGGYDNRTEHDNPDVTLNIKGTLVLGGAEILN